MKSASLALGLALLVGCTVETSDGNGSGGSGNASGGGAGSGSGGSAGSGSGGSAGSGSGGSGGLNAGCVSLCSHTDSATSAQIDCVGAQAILKGYDWPSDQVCPVIANESQCQLCAMNTSMAGGDCLDIEAACFGGNGGSGSGGSGGSGSGGGGSGGSGSGGTGGGGVTSCKELCDHAPTSTPQQRSCVQAQSLVRGYDWSTEPVCQAAATEVGCNACAASLNMKDTDCASIYGVCF